MKFYPFPESRLNKSLSITILFFAVLYTSSYWHFSRQWIDAEAELRIIAILYTSNDGDLTKFDLEQHSFLAIIYSPLNWIDHQLFRTPQPPKCLLLDLS